MAVYLGVSTLGAAASMQIPRLPVEGSPKDVHLAYRDVSFASRVDNVTLKGWFLPSSGNDALVIVHGGFQNRLDPVVGTINLTRDLVGKGYNVLLFDLRGRGESSGKGISLSNMDKDIGGAVDYLKSIGYPSEKIGLMGVCSGAAGITIFASHESIGGIVLEGCFSSVNTMVSNLATQFGIPRLPEDVFIPGVKLAAGLFYGYREVDPIDVIGNVQCPIFFIHEENDELVFLKDDLALLHASVNPDNTLWQVPGADHACAYQTHPVEYVNKVDAFFSSCLGGSN